MGVAVCLSAEQVAAGTPREHPIVVETRFTHLTPPELTIEPGDRVILKRPGASTDVAFRVRVSPSTGTSALTSQLDLQHVLGFEAPGAYTVEVSSEGTGLSRDLRARIVVPGGPEAPATATAPSVPGVVRPGPAGPPPLAPPPRSVTPPAAPPADQEPPRIAIAHPRDEQRVSEQTLAVTGIVQDNAAIVEVELTVNRQRIEAERGVMFLDTCYNGAAGGRTFAARRTRATSLDDLVLERLTRSQGRAISTASRPAEVSIELPELGHGIFTSSLVRGLQGAADLNRTGIVILQNRYESVEQQVSEKSRAVGGNPRPVMKGELEGPLPLVRVGAR